MNRESHPPNRTDPSLSRSDAAHIVGAGGPAAPQPPPPVADRMCSHAAELHGMQRALHELESHRFARAALDALADHVCVLDATGRIIMVNSTWRSFASTYRPLHAHDFVGANYFDACANADADARADAGAVAAGLRDVLAGRERFQYEYLCTLPGQSRWFLLKATRFSGSGEVRVVVAHEDITERKQVSARLLQVNRLYQALSDANHAVTRVRDRDALCSEVAGIAVRAGLFKTVKIWMRDADTPMVRAVICRGQEGPLLDAETRLIDLSGPEGLGPTGVALREGHPDVCNDLDDERSRPWRARNARAGLRSSAAFPLREEGAVIGTLSVYASETGYFDDQFVVLLARIAASLSIGLDNLRREARRAETEAALRDSEARFRSLTELSADWYWQQDENLRFTGEAGGVATGGGPRRNSDCGKTRWELPVIDLDEAAWTAHKATLAARLPFRDFQFCRREADGSEVHLNVSGAPIFDATGRFTGYRGIGTDITARKTGEKILALEHQVARYLAGSGETLSIIDDVIGAICHSQTWSCGFFSRIDESAAALCVGTSWGMPDVVVETFMRAAREVALPRGRGLAGQVWLTGQPVWTEDTAAGITYPQPELLSAAGMRCGFAFPITSDDHTLGTMTFFSTVPRPLNVRLISAARIIGSQVGQFLKRRDAEEALRESEARFRSLTNLSADWYWQQDADLRFTSPSNGVEIEAGFTPDADIGRTRWELSGIGDTQWDEHKATLAARRPFHDFELKRTFPDGTVRDVCISGAPIFDAAGTFRGYRGIGRDITRRRHEERILALEHRVARCIASTDDTSLMLSEVIQAICETEAWSWGTYFRVDDTGTVLRVQSIWAMPDQPPDALIATTRELTIAPGEGISGRVWRSGRPLWVRDTSADTQVLRAKVIIESGFRGAFAFPTIADGQTIGVMLFFSRQVREPNARLLAAAQMIGTQVGQCLSRKHAEDALRDSETRYRALTALSSDWYWEQDENQRFTRVSEGMERRSGLPANKVIGRTRWETGFDYEPHAREALEAYLDARVPFQDFVYRRIDAAGVTRQVNLSGEPMFDATGRYVGYRGIGKDITERKRADDQLRFQALLLNTVGDAVMATDLEGVITYWSATAEQLYGWPAAMAIGRSMVEMIQPVAGGDTEDAALQQAIRGDTWRGDQIGHRRDGTEFSAYLTLAPVHAASGAVSGVVGVSRDVSERKRAEQVIRDSARQQELIAAFGQRALASTRLNVLLEQAALAVAEGLSVPFCKILQLAPDGQSLVGRAGLGWGDDWVDQHAAESGPGMADHYVFEAHEAVVVADYANDRRFASPAFVSQHGIRSGANVFIGGADGPFGVLGAYSVEPRRFRANSVNFLQSIANTLATAIDRIAAEKKVAYLAQFDALTGLPNRNLFRDRFALTLTQAQRNGWNIAVMFVDLDAFKAVNDNYGHGTGDRLLSEVAERLGQCVRSGDTVGRLGGDEFAIVLSNLARADDANLVVQQVVDAVARPFDIKGQQVRVTCSVGIAVYPADGDDPELLLNHSDAAMYIAKQRGGNGFHFYTEELNARVTRRMAVEGELRQAVENHEFVLFYQPQVSLDTGRIIGVEALIRWQHPARGLLAPAEFIAIAEETGLIVPIGQWVTENACAQAAQWQRRGHRGLFVAINVSPLEIRRGNVIENIRHALAQSGLEPRFLEIELTETLVMDGAESFIRALAALKATGISIAIDDFGTGYSSLSYLKRFPIDKVKIDHVFIRDLITETDDAAIVQAIIAMSHHLQLRVTAEGVETEEQAGFLRRCQCDNVQGFLFGAPMSAAQMSALLDSSGSLPLLPETRGSARTLLLVDDEENNLRALKRVLRGDGYHILTATSGQQALEVLAHTAVAVIVSDQRMPGMSGTELLSRAKTLYPETVRIVLSGFTDLGTITAAINEGAIYKFLTKPWEDDALRDDIRGAFRLFEQQRAALNASLTTTGALV